MRVLALAGESVTVHGDVPDVFPYLDAAAVVAAPIRYGGGMRVKVLEALASGKAMVATPLALEGLAVRDGEHVLVAETDEEFAAALSSLLDAPQKRRADRHRRREWAEAKSRPRARSSSRTAALGKGLAERRGPSGGGTARPLRSWNLRKTLAPAGQKWQIDETRRHDRTARPRAGGTSRWTRPRRTPEEEPPYRWRPRAAPLGTL